MSSGSNPFGKNGGGTSGGDLNIDGTRSLLSESGKADEITQVLAPLKAAELKYGSLGTPLSDIQIATLGASDAGVMAYYDSLGNLAVSDRYFNAEKMDKVYDRCVEKGFHPSRGDKTGLEAVAAHELGHALTDEAGRRNGYGTWAVDRMSNEIVAAAAKKAGYKGKTAKFRAEISGYAKKNNAETIAEAYADVYCNGAKGARRASKFIVAELEYRLSTGRY